MKIFKIEVKNYRLLKDFSMDVEDDLSLVIGKNNSGKTSILTVLDKFLRESKGAKFNFYDFNIDFQTELKDKIDKIEKNEVIKEDGFERLGINLRLFIEYTEKDNLSNISRVMMDLEPDNNVIVLGFEYSLDYDEYVRLEDDYKNFKNKEQDKTQDDNKYIKRELKDFLNSNHSSYFKIRKYSLAYDKGNRLVNNKISIDLDIEKINIDDIINFKYISAKRDVANKDIDKTLSSQTSRIYKKTESNNDLNNKAIENFKDHLNKTDKDLDHIYSEIFKGIVGKINDFGGMKINESTIQIISTLQHRELLEGNTTVVYKHDEDNVLPEHYNGLGYMNLISMIFEIEILVSEFKREKDKKPADINLLFIEEPEAHTHPQMQYVFIKNIKKLLEDSIKMEDAQNLGLQYIISTHSAHIVANSDFETIKYLKKDDIKGINAKNLKDLKEKYGDETLQYDFLKQYLTISRAEIFFADKVILIEGDTERILLPTFMRKLDVEEEKENKESRSSGLLPLLSQNISIVEIGAHSQVFELFIDFLGVKALIITDIDSIKKKNVEDEKSENEACSVKDGTDTSNSAIKHYLAKTKWEDLKQLPQEKRIIGDKLLISYQLKEEGYHARSFEDSFIHINKQFIIDNKVDFKGLQNKSEFREEYCAYKLAERCIKKKTHFALDIIYNGGVNFGNWKIPSYIKEGLQWLKQD